VRVISWNTLRDYVAARRGRADHGALDGALRSWNREVEDAEWQSMADIKAKYASASVVGRDRLVFNICGNSYRLIVAVKFDFQTVWIKWIGTHAEYD
jgi:mRNA interferase HigB